MPDNVNRKAILKNNLSGQLSVAMQFQKNTKQSKKAWLQAANLALELAEITSFEESEGIEARFRAIFCLVDAGEVDQAQDLLSRFIAEGDKKLKK